jgi:hypothetical protein
MVNPANLLYLEGTAAVDIAWTEPSVSPTACAPILRWILHFVGTDHASAFTNSGAGAPLLTAGSTGLAFN